MLDTEEHDIIDTAKTLNVGAVVPELYKDAISPAAKEIGKGLQTIAKAANLALRPVAGLVWGYEKIEDYIASELPKKIRSKDPKKIVTPELHLAGPLLESLKFTGYQDILREMYLHLLATSMDKDAAIRAHPTFVEIIRQLSPDEAKLLAFIGALPGYPEIDANWFARSWWKYEVYGDMKNRFKAICERAEVKCPELYLSYLDNLRRLQLIDFKQEVGEIEISNSGGNLKVEQESREYMFVTSLGQQFIDACLGENMEDVGEG
ncbi:DUF4393 domain-containing protein [Microbulbifer sp. JMSA004]|uniref:DUF4393 domain-containing protein n=1 Tax=unclassified Microbulbifer TaxID=2619833 RepID=UPI00403A87F2